MTPIAVEKAPALDDASCKIAEAATQAAHEAAKSTPDSSGVGPNNDTAPSSSTTRSNTLFSAATPEFATGLALIPQDIRQMLDDLLRAEFKFLQTIDRSQITPSNPSKY